MSAAVVPDNVDPGTGEITPPEGFRLPWEPMNREQAVTVKGQINAYAIRLPLLVKEAKDGEAWKALDCTSWTEFVNDHLVISMEYARLLLRGADKLEELAAETGVPVALFEIPERLLRQIDTPTMVGVGREAVAELPAGTTPEDQAAAIDAAVRDKVTEQKLEEAAQRGREKAAKDIAEANARREAAERDAELERLRREEERRARKEAEQAISDGGAPLALSDAPDAPAASGATPHGEAQHATTADAPEADTDGAGQHAPHADGDDGGAASSSAAVPPSLPDDWRQRFDNTTWLIGISVAALRPALSVDPDRLADARDLHAYLTDLLADPETETP